MSEVQARFSSPATFAQTGAPASDDSAFINIVCDVYSHPEGVVSGTSLDARSASVEHVEGLATAGICSHTTLADTGFAV